MQYFCVNLSVQLFKLRNKKIKQQQQIRIVIHWLRVEPKHVQGLQPVKLRLYDKLLPLYTTTHRSRFMISSARRCFVTSALSSRNFEVLLLKTL